MSIIQSAMHLADSEKAVNGVDQYQPPKKRKNKDKKQRNEKGQFIKGNNLGFQKNNTLALKWTEEKALALALELIEWMKYDESNFLMKDFLIEKDLYADLIADLSHKYPCFAEHIARAKEIEAHRIQKFALTNNLNPGMAQWVLAVNHQKHNVQKQEITGKNGSPLTTPTIILQPVKAVPIHAGEDNSK